MIESWSVVHTAMIKRVDARHGVLSDPVMTSDSYARGSAHLCRGGLIAIVRAAQDVNLPTAIRALSRGGVRVAEITLNTPGALRAIERIRREWGREDGWIGAGTALSAADAVSAVGAGAQFIVTPTLVTDAIRACRGHGVPIVCGCATLAEMLEATRLGAEFIKLFPATRFGPDYVRSVLEVMPSLQIVPTGGVSATNVAEYFDAGVAAVAVGSQLVSPRVLAEARWDELTAVAADLVAAVSRVRQRTSDELTCHGAARRSEAP